MTLLILGLILAFIIAFGRQITVFRTVQRGLWFFYKFNIKRFWFTVASIVTIGAGLYQEGISMVGISIAIVSGLFLLFAHLFDMRYFFPRIVSVQKKESESIDVPDYTRVIGVHIDGVAIAYPLEEIVIPRHIINDVIEDIPVVVSYCALCRSALAFNAQLDGKALQFSVVGVWRRNMIMQDHITESLWQQATGECIYGPLKGRKLELLSGINTTWASWLKEQEVSLYVSDCTEKKGYLSREQMNKAIDIATNHIIVPGFSDISGIPPREAVFGVTYESIDRAYLLSTLKKERVKVFTDEFKGKELELNFNEKSESLTATAPDSSDVLVEKHWWLGWKEFHPNTEIWKKID